MAKIVKTIVMLCLLLALAAGVYFWQQAPRLIGSMALNLSADAEFSIQNGQSAAVIAKNLEQRQIIANAWLLRLYWQRTGGAHQLQAGDYQLPQGMTIQQMLASFAKGALREYPFTIIEGWQLADLIAALKAEPKLQHTLPDLPREKLYPYIMTELGAAEVFAEGMFLPQTYYFNKNTTDMAILRRAYHLLEEELASAWQSADSEIQKLYQKPYQALIMASIVEKETGKPEERPLIAGVFVNRLNKGMRLQTDPTVIYGMGANYKGNIRYKDLRTDTAYNTYTRAGLPPTPIALAGSAAIKAALHPEKTKALYFVSRNDGSHAFSETLQQHNRAVDQYQRKRAKP